MLPFSTRFDNSAGLLLHSMVSACIQDTLSSRTALGLPAECVARAKVSCIQGCRAFLRISFALSANTAEVAASVTVVAECISGRTKVSVVRAVAAVIAVFSSSYL